MRRVILFILALIIAYFSIGSFEAQEVQPFEYNVSLENKTLYFTSNSEDRSLGLKISPKEKFVHENGIFTKKGMGTLQFIDGYVIGVKRQNNTLYLQGIQGTNWKNLEVKCKSFDCDFTLNQDGLVSK